MAEVVQQGAVLEQVMTENPFEVETIATESHMEIQKSNFRCSEEQEEITQAVLHTVWLLFLRSHVLCFKHDQYCTISSTTITFTC